VPEQSGGETREGDDGAAGNKNARCAGGRAYEASSLVSGRRSGNYGISRTHPPARLAQSPDTPAARRDAALKYLAAVPSDAMVDEMIDALAKRMPAARRDEFVRLMKKITPLDKIKALTLEGMVKHFTVAAIDALTRFYGSAEGKAILKKFGVYMGEILPGIQAEVLRALQEVRAEMQI